MGQIKKIWLTNSITMISCHCELKSKDNWDWQFQQAVIWRGGRKRESAAEQVTRRRLNLEYVDSVLNVERQTCSRENLDAWQHAWQHDGPQAHVSSISAFFSATTWSQLATCERTYLMTLDNSAVNSDESGRSYIPESFCFWCNTIFFFWNGFVFQVGATKNKKKGVLVGQMDC